MLKRLKVIVLALMLSQWMGTVQAEWVEWLADSRLSFNYNDNINNTFISSYARSDEVWTANLSGGRAYQVTDFSRLYLSAEAEGDIHHQFEQLNQYGLGGKALYSYKLGLGWSAPVLSFSASALQIFSNSQLRNGAKVQTGFRLSQWLYHEVLHVHLGYKFDHRNGSGYANDEHQEELAGISHSVFDIQGHTVEALFNLSVSQTVRVNVGYAWRWGDITSNNEWEHAEKYVSHTAAVNKDDALPGWIYRVYGTTQTIDVGLTYSFLSGHALTSISYRRVDTDALDTGYENNQLRLNLSYSF